MSDEELIEAGIRLAARGRAIAEDKREAFASWARRAISPSHLTACRHKAAAALNANFRNPAIYLGYAISDLAWCEYDTARRAGLEWDPAAATSAATSSPTWRGSVAPTWRESVAPTWRGSAAESAEVAAVAAALKRCQRPSGA